MYLHRPLVMQIKNPAVSQLRPQEEQKSTREQGDVMMPNTGIEPATSSLLVRRSTDELIRHFVLVVMLFWVEFKMVLPLWISGHGRVEPWIEFLRVES